MRDAQEHSGVSAVVPKKQEKTAEELAAMIHADLSMIDGCPTRGLKVTVYGLNPWNSLLTFGIGIRSRSEPGRPTGVLRRHHRAVETALQH